MDAFAADVQAAVNQPSLSWWTEDAERLAHEAASSHFARGVFCSSAPVWASFAELTLDHLIKRRETMDRYQYVEIVAEMARIIVAEDAEHQPKDKDAVTGGNRAAVPAKSSSEPDEIDESEAWEACSEGSARAASESDASEVFSEADDEHATADKDDAKSDSELKRDGGRFDLTELRRLEATGVLGHLRVDVALVEALAGLEEAEAKAFLGIDGPPVARRC